MVIGAWPATMAAAAGGGARWQRVPEREEEREEAQGREELTTSTLPWSETAGEGRRRRDDA